MKRVLSVILAIIMSVSLLAVTGYARNFQDKDIASVPVQTGDEIILSGSTEGKKLYYEFENASIVLVDGKTPKEADGTFAYEADEAMKVKFLKSGTINVYSKCVYTSVTGMVEYKKTTYVVSRPNAILNETIKVHSEFSESSTVPQFNIEDSSRYEIESAYVIYNGDKFYPGDVISGSWENSTIEIILKAKYGNFFVFEGDEDDSWSDSSYEVEYGGVKYNTVQVNHISGESKLKIQLPIQYEKGVHSLFVVSDLEKPYHNCPVDTSAIANDGATVKSIKYTVAGASRTSCSIGEKVSITVRIKSKDGVTIDPEGSAYWKEQGVWSSQTNKIGNSEAEYIFECRVEGNPNKIINNVNINVADFVAGNKYIQKVTSETEGIVVGEVSWTPNDSAFEIGKEYTIKVKFKTDGGHLIASDFKDNGKISINGEKAEFFLADSEKQIYFAEAVLTPSEAKTTDNYTFPFNDVASSQWYYANVKTAHKMGLINGKKADKFAPDDNMTVSEAVKLAACMNVLYNGGDPAKELSNGTDVWYSTYMKYALDNKIIDKDLSSRAGEKITRLEYACIFSKALPARAFTERNNIPTGSIPDVKSEDSAENKAVYTLYRAGVIAGTDSKGTFNPQSNIKRSEVATILVRMMDSSTRVPAPADLAK